VKKIENMDRDELLQLRKDVDAALKTVDDRRRKEAHGKLEEMAREMGFTLADFAGGQGKARSSVGVPKYVHPEIPSKTWSGRGRQPQWYKDAIASGKSEDDLAI
jgi:DNA-binding protein H-NS